MMKSDSHRSGERNGSRLNHENWVAGGTTLLAKVSRLSSIVQSLLVAIDGFSFLLLMLMP